MKQIKSVLVIGSGPIIIGQAAEFDYSGSQALQVLREKNIRTILINPNPATIMTDKTMADVVYMQPLTGDFLKKIILKEKPDGILSSFGGQSALNLSKELASESFLEKENVSLLGSSLQSIKLAEDRLLFRDKMISIGVNVPDGKVVSNIKEGMSYSQENCYPLIIRPAYTMGGSGGGMAYNESELLTFLKTGLDQSSINQCLIEKSIKGLKEIEFEIMRDHKGNCISICHMENIDPVGIHTGESIVVCPIQSLSDKEIQSLRSMSLKIVNSLNIIGACNVQLAYDSKSQTPYVIEVNPRVSRSSALASKATGYPIAKIAAQVILGQSLDEIQNPITQKTFASFEPTLDYIVVKIPRWPFDKFTQANCSLSTQMKSTGEVMSIGTNFSSAFLKALRSLELKDSTNFYKVLSHKSKDDLIERLRSHSSDWYLNLIELMRRGESIDQLESITQISSYFLYQINQITKLEKRLKDEELNKELLYQAKKNGFTNEHIHYFTKSKVDINSLLETHQIFPVFRKVDTCAGEFEAHTPYFYHAYGESDEFDNNSSKEKVVILGSGPIRIGQGIEFDYSCTHGLLQARNEGFETIMINNNPETCSTDFSMSDKLYFEPLYKEDVLNILRAEKPKGVIVQFGGQSAINLAEDIVAAGFDILGTSLESINLAEDRNQFEELLNSLDIKRPKANIINSFSDLELIKEDICFPVVARPSFVLGGANMEVLYTFKELENYTYKQGSFENPILIDEYIKGKEIEVDALSDGETIVIPGIMEHIERAGVHSGDSISVYPPQSLYPEVINEIKQTTIKLAQALNIKGVMNIQYTYKKGALYVLEVNPRASRTVPFISKMTGINMARLATQVCLGKKLKELGYKTGLIENSKVIGVKVPVFSFSKLTEAEPGLGPEMKSTGEVIGTDHCFENALYKGLLASGIKLPEYGRVLFTISERYKKESLSLARKFYDFGFSIIATSGTKKYLEKNLGVQVEEVSKINEGSHGLLNLIQEKRVDLVINTLSKGKESNTDGFKMRRLAFENNIPCFTSLDTVKSILKIYKKRNLSVETL